MASHGILNKCKSFKDVYNISVIYSFAAGAYCSNTLRTITKKKCKFIDSTSDNNTNHSGLDQQHSYFLIK